MRYAFISDIHANLEALQTALDDIQSRSVDEVYCLGDIINYGANPNECLKRVRESARQVIQGNHEAALVSDAVADSFNPFAKTAIYWTRERLAETDRRALSKLPFVFEKNDWVITHSTLESPEDFDYLFDPADALRSFKHMHASVCFYGHTHVPILFSEKSYYPSRPSVGRLLLSREDRYIINVGSVGQPRDRDPRLAYLIFDDDRYEIEWVRLAYDWNLTARKIREAGLPYFLADRLGAGV